MSSKKPTNRATFDPADWISQADAARLRNVSTAAIATLVRRGRLTTLKVGGRRFVKRSDIESFKMLPVGRPSEHERRLRQQSQSPSRSDLIESSEDWISQANAAKLRDVSRQAISDLVKRGRLSTITVAGRTLLLRSDVESFEKLPKYDLPPKEAKVKPKPDKPKKR